MHAQVRRLLLRSPRWDRAAWGLPINQHDMVATSLLFSHVFLDGLRLLGLQLTREEADDYVHLWRCVGWLLGADPALLPDREAEARSLTECIYLTQGPPDADSRALTAALLRAPLQAARTPGERRAAGLRVRLSYSVCRHLIGNTLADALEVPPERHAFTMPALVRTLAGLDRLRAAVPGLEARAAAAGRRYWEAVVELGLDGAAATFAMPEKLARGV